MVVKTKNINTKLLTKKYYVERNITSGQRPICSSCRSNKAVEHNSLSLIDSGLNI